MKLQDRPLPKAPFDASIHPAVSDWMRQTMKYVSAFIIDVTNIINQGKLSVLQVDVLENEPVNLFNGMVAYADGTSWNPGSGEGFYGYENGAWVKL